MTREDAADAMERARSQTTPLASVRVLGGIAATIDGLPIDLGGPRQRAVLGLLVAAGGTTVPAVTVADRLWGTDAPASPQATLQSYISHLRRALEPGTAARSRGALLASEGRGYALRLPRDAVDAWRFEDLVHQGVALGEDAAAVAPLRAALSLWRGHPYADHDTEPWAGAESARLDALRGLAVEHLAAARLAAGEHIALIPELERLVDEDPLREDRRRLLALALYRAGRQAQALAALRDAREALAERLGLDPGPALQALEAGILAHDPALAAPGTGAKQRGGEASVDVSPPRDTTRPVPAPDPLVDRERELAQLTRVLQDTIDGSGGTVLISGPAGIGKTRLLAETRRAAAARGVIVLTARGSLLEREFGFGVVRQLFEPLLSDPQARERLLSGAAGPAASAFDLDGSAPSGGETPFAIIHGLYRLVLRVAQNGPVAIAVDDVQWCDTGTLRFLSFLARRVADQRVLVIATRRTGEQYADDDIVAELAQDPETVVVEPPPLSREGTADVVEGLLGDADSAFTAACHRTTGGNPLLLRQLVRALQAEGVRPDTASADTVTAVGGRAVSSIVARRVEALGPEVVALARAVAVLGDGSSLSAAAAFAELDEPVAADAASAAAEAEVLRDEHPLGFVHPLVRDAVYHGLSAARRGLAHDRAARLLEAHGAAAEVVAAHLLLTPPRGSTSTVDLLEGAARVALDRGAPESAVSYYQRALEEPPTAARRPELLAALGAAEIELDGVSALARLRSAHAELPPSPLAAEVSGMIAQTLVFAGTQGEATSFAFAEKRRVTDADSLQRLEAAGRLGGYMHGIDANRWQRRDATVEGEGIGARMLAATLAWEKLIAGEQREEAVRLARFALDGPTLLDGDPGLYWVVAIMVRDYADDDIGTFWDDVLVHVYERGSLFSSLATHLWHGHHLLYRGDLREALHELRLANEQSLIWRNDQIGYAYGLACLVDALLERGDVEAAHSLIDDLDVHPFFGDSRRLLIEAQAELALAEGRPDASLALFDEASTHLTRVENPVWHPWRSQRARAFVQLGRTDEAVELAADELRAAERWGAPRGIGRSARVLGELRGTEGRDELERAVELLAPSTARLEFARALTALAGIASGHRRVELLTQAYELAQECGADGLRREIGGQLRKLDAPLPPELVGLARLTVTERRAAQLLADGLDVNDIAERLFVTPRAVRDALAEARAALGVADDASLRGAIG